MGGQTRSFPHRPQSGIWLLFQILVCSAVSSNHQNVHASAMADCSFRVDARAQTGSPILSGSRLRFMMVDFSKFTDMLPFYCTRLRGGCNEAQRSPSCVPIMYSVMNSASARALTYAQSLRQLGAATISWFTEMNRMRSYSSLQSQARQFESKQTDAHSREEQYLTSDGRSPGSGGSDPSSTPVSYDVILSCLPRGVAARRVQVCILMQ
jgi:hypothetical protein